MSDTDDKIIEHKVRLSAYQFLCVTAGFVVRVWDGFGDDPNAEYLCIGYKWLRVPSEPDGDVTFYFKKHGRGEGPPDLAAQFTYSDMYGHVPNPLAGLLAASTEGE